MEMVDKVLKALGDPSLPHSACRYRKPSLAAEPLSQSSAGPANHGAASFQLGHLKRQNHRSFSLSFSHRL